jgi:hypothetical protein
MRSAAPLTVTDDFEDEGDDSLAELDDDYDADLRAFEAPTVPDGTAHSCTEHAAPHSDSLNNPYVRVVHTSGLHYLPIVSCTCLVGDEQHANLLSCRLIPASFTRYRTLFTGAVLDDFRMSNLECKVSAYQYFHKLRCLTNPESPAAVPSFYHELLRLSRLWRWIKKLKWAGYGHKTVDPTKPQAGELAIFCPACPQPGINVSPNWKRDPNRFVGHITCITMAIRYMLIIDGYINGFLLPMETLKRIMCGKRTKTLMSGSRKAAACFPDVKTTKNFLLTLWIV